MASEQGLKHLKEALSAANGLLLYTAQYNHQKTRQDGTAKQEGDKFPAYHQAAEAVEKLLLEIRGSSSHQVMQKAIESLKHEENKLKIQTFKDEYEPARMKSSHHGLIADKHTKQMYADADKLIAALDALLVLAGAT